MRPKDRHRWPRLTRISRTVWRWLTLPVLAWLGVVPTPEGSAGPPADFAPPGLTPLSAPGIHNFFAVGTHLFSGSAPEGDAGFAALEKRGIKTLISVDGAKPDVAGAHRHGLRYIHLPHGYDGIAADLQTQLVKAVQTQPGPVYLHCHHGQHRGPTAVAVIALAMDSWTKVQAESWLHIVGTSTNYPGLYETVRRFAKPTPAALALVPPEFPEVATVSKLTDFMVQIDRQLALLKAARAAGYSTPATHPEVQPANAVTLLREHYREIQRLESTVALGPDFKNRLDSAEREAQHAAGLLARFSASPTASLRHQLDETFDAMTSACAACHRKYRDANRPRSPH